jgi:peptidoglycan/LPS O-acetylase OafA/YrhL
MHPLKAAQQTEVPQRRIHWEVLALLRAGLAWIVVCAHLTLFTSETGWQGAINQFGGKAAVVGFLLVSGFSIRASLERDAEGFYRRRFLRVYPLYFVALVCAFGLELWTGGHVVIPGQSIAALGWKADAANLIFLQTFAVRPIQFDWPVWSLAIEVFYYVLAPIFERLNRSLLIALILFSLGCYLLPKHSDWGPVYFVLTRFNALEFLWCWLLGFLLWRDSSPIVLAVSLLGMPAMLWGDFSPEPLSVVTYVLALAVLVFSDKLAVFGALRRFANYLGDLSYPLYVFHVPALILGYAVLHVRSPNGLAILAIGVSVAAYQLVDRSFKPRFIAPLLLNGGGFALRPARVQPRA